MPGAPNRPPEIAGAPPAATPDAPATKVLRRLVPSHVALLLDSWKGPVAAEVADPFEKAEAAVAAGDWSAASNALDLLSIRFAEPRWPTLPEPFRRLRVKIPAPVPPHWDPDHGLAAPEKEVRKARRVAEDELALADGSVAWATAHGLGTPELSEALGRARAALAGSEVGPEFYPNLDGIWAALRPKLPRPKRVGRAAAAPAEDA